MDHPNQDVRLCPKCNIKRAFERIVGELLGTTVPITLICRECSYTIKTTGSVSKMDDIRKTDAEMEFEFNKAGYFLRDDKGCLISDIESYSLFYRPILGDNKRLVVFDSFNRKEAVERTYRDFFLKRVALEKNR